MTNGEAVNWLINISADIGKSEHRDLWHYEQALYEIREMLESAQPEHKTGKWIKIPEFCGDDVSGFIDNHFSCSECKKEAEINTWGFYILSDFCPNCGADMREQP